MSLVIVKWGDKVAEIDNTSGRYNILYSRHCEIFELLFGHGRYMEYDTIGCLLINGDKLTFKIGSHLIVHHDAHTKLTYVLDAFLRSLVSFEADIHSDIENMVKSFHEGSISIDVIYKYMNIMMDQIITTINGLSTCRPCINSVKSAK